MTAPEKLPAERAEGPAPVPGSETLTDRAYARLEELIVTLQLRPGEVLSEAGLTKLLGIGRTPIREALQRLSMEGLVVILPRRGVLVSEINVRSQLELLRVRREVERLMARLSAVRCTRDERESFRELAEAMEGCAVENNDIEFMRLDKEFNLLVARTCRNEYARKTMGLLQGLARRFWYQHYKETLDLPRCARLHAAMAKSISEGDPDPAGEALDELIDYMESFTRNTLEAGAST